MRDILVKQPGQMAPIAGSSEDPLSKEAQCRKLKMKIPRVLVHYKKHFDIWENSIQSGLILFLIFENHEQKDRISDTLTYYDYQKLLDSVAYRQARLQPMIKFYVDQQGYKAVMDGLEYRQKRQCTQPSEKASNQIFQH